MASDLLAAVERLRDVGGLLPSSRTPRFSEGAHDDDLAQLETTAEDFVAFLRLHRAVVAMDVWNGYWIGATESGVLRLPNLPRVIDAAGAEMTAVPVATDGGGNAFYQSAESARVFRWTRETGRTHLVADDFTEFLHHVADDWTHAARNDPNWKYLVDARRYAAT